MGLFPHEHETIEGVGRELRQGRRTCVDVLERCLDRIAEWEPRLKAWVVVDRAAAHEQARVLDQELAAGHCRGFLHGIPIGVKDIIDVAGLPTAAGFAPWSDRLATRDAGIVASLRAAGSVILGKTVTTQFAWIDPPPTRNPWNLERTPGGSSSGSAAAVACGMCLGALGTQTGGSIIRPASFCGVAGLKPSFIGRLDGILPFAPSLDHPGPIARSVRDLALMIFEFRNRDDVEPQPPGRIQQVAGFAQWFGMPKPDAPRLGRLRGAFEDRAEPAMLGALDWALDALAGAGAEVVDVPVPFDVDEVLADHRTIMAAEVAAGHARRMADHPDDYRPRIRALVEEGQGILATAYLDARRYQEHLRLAIGDGLEEFDALVMPATAGAAPDPSTTGDPAFNSPWSFSGLPAISFPIGLAPDGLPLAMQLIEPRQLRELELIGTAGWCEAVIRRADRPRSA